MVSIPSPPNYATDNRPIAPDTWANADTATRHNPDARRFYHTAQHCASVARNDMARRWLWRARYILDNQETPA